MVAVEATLGKVPPSFVEDDVGIRTAKAEAIDARSAGSIDRPWGYLKGDLERNTC